MILIAGPCVIEEVKGLNQIATELRMILNHFPTIDFYFKASCTKDNRTKLKNYYGPGFQRGIILLQDIKKEYGFKITTDFHNEKQIRIHGKYVDLIQIPAFLARQTSLLKAAAETGKPVHIKKPQFLSPHKIYQLYDKIFEINKKAKVYITDRGTCFGYDQWMFDPRHIKVMKKSNSQIKVLADVTHPNYCWDSYTYAYELGASAIVSGADGVFLETHNDVMSARCDSDVQIPVREVWEYINNFYILYNMKEKISRPNYVEH
jgi:2-dehydro-3-deoxyphosphooctonate aldolase (KDO 8-P synthase)